MVFKKIIGKIFSGEQKQKPDRARIDFAINQTQPRSQATPFVVEADPAGYAWDDGIDLSLLQMVLNGDLGHPALNRLLARQQPVEGAFSSPDFRANGILPDILAEPVDVQAKIIARAAWISGEVVRLYEARTEDHTGLMQALKKLDTLTFPFKYNFDIITIRLSREALALDDDDARELLTGVRNQIRYTPYYAEERKEEYLDGVMGCLDMVSRGEQLSASRLRALAAFMGELRNLSHPLRRDSEALRTLMRNRPEIGRLDRDFMAIQWAWQKAETVIGKITAGPSPALNQAIADLAHRKRYGGNFNEAHQAAFQAVLDADPAQRGAAFMQLLDTVADLRINGTPVNQVNNLHPLDSRTGFNMTRITQYFDAQEFIKDLAMAARHIAGTAPLFDDEQGRRLFEMDLGLGQVPCALDLARTLGAMLARGVYPKTRKAGLEFLRRMENREVKSAANLLSEHREELLWSLRESLGQKSRDDSLMEKLNNMFDTIEQGIRPTNEELFQDYLEEEYEGRRLSREQLSWERIFFNNRFDPSRRSAESSAHRLVELLREHDFLDDRFAPRVQTLMERARQVIDPEEESLLMSDLGRFALYHGMAPAVRKVWLALEDQAESMAAKPRPTAKWLATVQDIAAPADPMLLSDLLRRFMAGHVVFPIHDKGHVERLRGLIWMAAHWPHDDLAPLLTDLAQKKCFRTMPQVGIRSEKLGNAILWYLSNLPDGAGVPHLARLLARIRYPKVKKKINQALNEAASTAGMTRGALDELSLPDHGLDKDGHGEFPIGDGAALVSIIGTAKTELTWRIPEGKVTKSVPAALKAFTAEIKDIKKIVKEIEADLSDQRARLQRLYLENRRWTAENWIKRYADHPLVSQIARRLIWNVHHREARTAGLWRDGGFQDIAGNPVDLTGAEISLWHPLGCPVEETLAWRGQLATLAIVQPFKQAHREIYVITDAERETATYSNRFAGHILKQHQMVALAQTIGWKVAHRMSADVANDQPTHLTIPAHGIIAEYWTEGAGDPGLDIADSGTYLYISTDQVRFYAVNPDGSARGTTYDLPRGEILELENVPAMVFSEVMRQVDLFVGVASVGNDPLWGDAGAQATHPNQWRYNTTRTYWRDRSFGDLDQMASTRLELLQQLLPSLFIADRCRIDGQFLRVQGNKRAYKIHLGSSNILMEPNDEYLCIVADQAKPGDKAAAKVHLPFEGDRVLSLILSKAFMLAADDKIKEAGILRQIE